MTTEIFEQAFRETSTPEMVAQYEAALDIIQNAQIAILQPLANAGKISALDQIYRTPPYVADRLDPTHPATIAAMLMIATGQKAYVYAEQGATPETSFSKMWANTILARLAEQCEQTIIEMAPKPNSSFITVDFQAHRDHFFRSIGKLPEHIILSGPNGAGKTVLGRILLEFIRKCGIQAETVKFPRPEGPLGSTILPILQGGKKLDAAALQLLFMSDVIDFHPAPETLVVFDRHPTFDALVYGPTGPIQDTLFSARALLDSIAWTFVINRHPYSSQQAVAARKKSPRIFEQDTEIMIEQLKRFAGLSNLPGMYWINNYNFTLTLRRLLGAVTSSGVIQRRMVKQGLVQSIGEAQLYVRNVFLYEIDDWERQIQ